MHRLVLDGFAICIAMLVPLVLVVLTTQRAMAEPLSVSDLLYISGSVTSGLSAEQPLSAQLHAVASNAINANLDEAFVSRSAGLPDSLQFAGLAGALNLVIDNSGSSPLVDGIELAPQETLRFVAGGAEQIRGLQGQISIRLDF